MRGLREVFLGDRFDVVGRGLEQVERRQFDVERRGRVEFERVRARRAGGGAAGAGSVVSIASVAGAPMGGIATGGGAEMTVAGVGGRFAPGTVAAGGVAVTSCDTDQLADEAAGAGCVVSVGVATAAGTVAIDGACVAVAAPMDVGDPPAAAATW